MFCVANTRRLGRGPTSPDELLTTAPSPGSVHYNHVDVAASMLDGDGYGIPGAEQQEINQSVAHFKVSNFDMLQELRKDRACEYDLVADSVDR